MKEIEEKMELCELNIRREKAACRARIELIINSPAGVERNEKWNRAEVIRDEEEGHEEKGGKWNNDENRIKRGEN